MIISIHSPLRGETGTYALPREAVEISIHSPLRGETRRVRNHGSSSADFNPLASERRDHWRARAGARVNDFNPLASERRDMDL